MKIDGEMHSKNTMVHTHQMVFVYQHPLEMWVASESPTCSSVSKMKTNKSRLSTNNSKAKHTKSPNNKKKQETSNSLHVCFLMVSLAGRRNTFACW